jgi:hypothetical protein
MAHKANGTYKALAEAEQALKHAEKVMLGLQIWT